MSKGVVAIGVWIALLLGSSVSEAADSGFPRCNCDDEGSLWSIESILECQRVSDFLIAVAYFSIPIELLYFVSCSNVPFKWVLFEFIAFIVLCGMTHLLNGWTYVHHPFQLMLALTVFKILTALVSCATAITLITLIPLLLKVKVREFMLKKKAWDLGREVGIIMKQREAGLHVRMLTQEIRKSLDRHTILYTTLVELSKTLGLQNCAVWMPNEGRTEMNLTHELRGRNYAGSYCFTIPITDPDIVRIKMSDDVILLNPESALISGSTGEELREAGPVAAIRVPMLRVSNFKGGTPELIQTCYAILVLVLPSGQPRSWTNQELEIVKVAVAISHAAVLEESQLMREKLEEQNRALQQAKRDAMMASQARSSFQKVMNDGLRRPMHTISGLLSLLREDGTLSHEQRTILDAMSRTGNVLSTLINDAMDIRGKEQNRFPLDVKPFRLHAMIREAASLSKCLCIYKGFGFLIEVDRSLPDLVMGDERRIFQVILHMVGNLLTDSNQGGLLTLRIFSESGTKGVGGGGAGDHHLWWATWRSSSAEGDVYIRFEVGVSNNISPKEGSVSRVQLGGRRYNSDGVEEGLSFSICKRLVQLMQGNIWVVPNPQGFAQSMTLLLRLHIWQSSTFEPRDSSSEYNTSSNSHLRGIKMLLAETDDTNRVVTAKLLEKLGCRVSTVSGSGIECLNAIRAGGSGSGSQFEVVILDLHMSEMDGFEVAAGIRKFRSRNWPVIVALTTSGEEDVWERCSQVGIKGVIRKPASLQGISTELQRVLQGSNRGLR
ncbi:ethylene receptor 2 isoform X2 [Punica granatum]|uniref:Ethylene receptor n=1 Tax=Punica granatum TaxID=22663 RepID=A0A6P8DW00_PUNGR|nr:ethylene receptor 2 isoform X2 [Punica granatum]